MAMSFPVSLTLDERESYALVVRPGFHDVEQSRESRSGAQAVDRAAALLDLVVSSPQPRSFTSLVADAGLAKSTTSRLLQALERNRLVQRDRNGSYRPGAVFAVYASRSGAVQDLADLAELSQAALERLADGSGETANFAVPRGWAVVQIAQADGRYLLGATNWIGVEVPPHCSALGKVFLAYGRLPLPDAALANRTPATVTDPAALSQELAEVRRRGWALAWEELEVGLAAVAAPVRGPDGAVVGALSVSGPTARLTRERIPGVASHVVEQATSLSQLLGHTHSPVRRNPGQTRKAGAA
jgi:IclR family transcriptional regulator, acetate operon repressor